LIRRPLARPANSFSGLAFGMVPGGTRPCAFVIPSAVEESLAIQEIFRDVSVRAGLAYSLDMTEAQQAAGLRDVRFNRPVRDARVNSVAALHLRN
jgi:hypothetical protein